MIPSNLLVVSLLYHKNIEMSVKTELRKYKNRYYIGIWTTYD